MYYTILILVRKPQNPLLIIKAPNYIRWAELLPEGSPPYFRAAPPIFAPPNDYAPGQTLSPQT